MAYSAPTTRATGFLVTAAVWNQDVVDNVTFLANPPSCRVRHDAAVSIANNTVVVLGTTAGTTAVFNTERFDTAAMHSTVTNPGRITFPVAGVYMVSFSGNLAAGTDYTHVVGRIRLNGTTVIASRNSGTVADVTTQPDFTLSTIYKFAANDYVEALVYQENAAAAARNLESNAGYSPEFSACWMGLG